TLPDQIKMCGSVSAVKSLMWVQHQAALLITGVLPSTFTNVLDVHANLFLFCYLVNKVCQCAAPHLCTLSESHSLYLKIAHTSRCLMKLHYSPLHKILHAY
ncbi:hypothetical protein BKA93DRAFT_720684, partial [Sparassis latifolia]